MMTYFARFQPAVAAVLLAACGGDFQASTATDAGPTGGSTGSGGATAGTSGTGGARASGGATSGGAAGRVGTGGASNGTGGTAGDAGSACPKTAPPIGSKCSVGLRCNYGSPCCGGAYQCSNDGTWQVLAFGCACQPPPSDAGPIACGSTTCSANEVCVQPAYNFCGPQPQCGPELDGGICPPGSTRMPCGGSSSPGCVKTPIPPPRFCAPMPASCGSTPNCACLPQSVCGASGADICSAVDGRNVSCLCVAP